MEGKSEGNKKNRYGSTKLPNSIHCAITRFHTLCNYPIPYSVQLDALCYLTESATPNQTITAVDDILRRCFIGR